MVISEMTQDTWSNLVNGEDFEEEGEVTREALMDFGRQESGSEL